MGEVYLAEDPRLRRKVAIKVLHPAHTLDPGRKARFLTEARAASSLHHSNIVTVFDIGREGETDFIVMEYVEGRTLREYLSRRPAELGDALEIAAQVASGLAAAHSCGIVHRDIKPENIIIGAGGTAKILDYGLAKLFESTPDAPTAEVQAITSPGALVGTVTYMSPEQVEANVVDHRSDIFSLGTVLCEMLTGRNPFASPSMTETFQRIVQSPQPVNPMFPTIPPRVAEILRRMLAQKPADRYQSARDLELDLRTAIRPDSDATAASPATRRSRRLPAVVALAAVTGIAGGALAMRALSKREQPAAPRITFASLTKDQGYEGEPTFSPDGQTLAYVSDRTGNFEIFLKQISGGPDINLTNDPADDVQPSFSPDGKQIVFVSTRSSVLPLLYRNPTIDPMGGDIWVMPALGGAPKRVIEDGNFPEWSPDGRSLAFVRGPWSDQKIYRAPAGGGPEAPIPITMDARPLFLTMPRFSPDGKWLAFNTHQPFQILIVPAEGGTAARLAIGRHPAWLPDSRSMVYSDLTPGRNATLSLVRIDDEGRAVGSPVPITSGRGEDRNPTLSRDGRTVLFASQTVSFNIERIAFDEATGKTIGAPEPITRGSDFAPFFSVAPDQRAIVFPSQRGLHMSLWRQEIATGALTQLAAEDDAGYQQPEWSPDGKMIAVTRTAHGKPGEAWVMRSDGGNARKIMDNGGFVNWSPDSRSLAYFDSGSKAVKSIDLATGAVRVLANEGTIRTLHKFSADGKWLVYQAIGRRGVTEVRVVPAGSTKSRVLVESANENGHPFFSADGSWVYYQRDHKNVFRIPGPAQNWKPAPPQQVTFFPESNLYLEQPMLSGDGRYLYFSRRTAMSDLWSARFEDPAQP
jgi:serine/threonine protein kinase